MRYKLGSYTRRESGACRASIYIAGRRLRATFETAEAARAWLAIKSAQKIELEAGGEIRTAGAPDVRYRDIHDELLRFYESGATRVHTARTLEAYRAELAAVMARWADARIAGTREAEIQHWVEEMRKAGLSTSTMRHRLDRLSACHQLAVRLGYLPAVPCRVQRPRLIQRSVVQSVSEAELGRMVAIAQAHDDPRVAAALLLAADAGLRRAEIHALRGEDALGERVHVAVRSEADRPKAGRGRTVPVLTGRLRAALAALEPERGRPLLADVSSPFVVCSLTTRAWRPVLGGRAQMHRLRHRFATRAADAGVPALQLARWLGHATLNVTMRYYHGGEVAPPGVGAALEG